MTVLPVKADHSSLWIWNLVVYSCTILFMEKNKSAEMSDKTDFLTYRLDKCVRRVVNMWVVDNHTQFIQLWNNCTKQLKIALRCVWLNTKHQSRYQVVTLKRLYSQFIRLAIHYITFLLYFKRLLWFCYFIGYFSVWKFYCLDEMAN